MVAPTTTVYDGDTLRKSRGQGMGRPLQSRAVSGTNFEIGSKCAIIMFCFSIVIPPANFCFTGLGNILFLQRYVCLGQFSET